MDFFRNAFRHGSGPTIQGYPGRARRDWVFSPIVSTAVTGRRVLPSGKRRIRQRWTRVLPACSSFPQDLVGAETTRGEKLTDPERRGGPGMGGSQIKRRSMTCSRQGRKSSCRWPRNPSVVREPDSRPTSLFRVDTWFSCLRWDVLECPDRSNPSGNGIGSRILLSAIGALREKASLSELLEKDSRPKMLRPI